LNVEIENVEAQSAGRSFSRAQNSDFTVRCDAELANGQGDAEVSLVSSLSGSAELVKNMIAQRGERT
jgi:hypothetical protein